MDYQESAKRGGRARIMEAAIRLFAQRGLDAVSVRDITAAARVNLGAVNYHFGSKEQLIRELYESLLNPLQAKRVELLDQIEAGAGTGPLDLELVLRALVEPTIRDVVGQKGPTTYLPRLMAQAYALPRPFLNDALAEQNDYIAKRFINALARAAPELSFEQVCWRYYLVVGGFLQLTSDSQGLHRLRRLSNGCCDTENPDSVIEELVAFFLHGMSEAPPSKKKPYRERTKPLRSR